MWGSRFFTARHFTARFFDATGGAAPPVTATAVVDMFGGVRGMVHPPVRTVFGETEIRDV